MLTFMRGREKARSKTRTRYLEATGARRLNAQLPSELQWRLRVKARHIYGFDNMTAVKHTKCRLFRSSYFYDKLDLPW